MRASVVIPAFNAAKTIDACLDGCLKQSTPALEIIVVDDGSTDDTRERVAKHAGVTLLTQANAGPAAARNYGILETQGEVVVFTDSDCIPEPEWIENLLRHFDKNVAGVGGTYGIVNRASRLARIVHAEILMRHARFGETVDFLGSFNVAYRKQALESVFGFDEEFRHASGEDNDLAYRLQDKGYTLRFTKKAVVRHYHPERLLPYLYAQYRHGYWRMKLYAKHTTRIQGDQYAMGADVIGPQYAAFNLVGIPVALILQAVQSYFLYPIVVIFPFVIFHALVHLPKTLNEKLDLSPRDRIRFWAAVVVRDYFRACGLLHGIFVFRPHRWKTAK